MSILELQTEQQPLEVQQLQAQFKLIAQKLVDGTPGLVDAMIEIHKITQTHEDLIALLSDDDIANLHKSHEKHKQFTLIQKNIKATTGAGKKKKLTEGDLGNL